MALVGETEVNHHRGTKIRRNCIITSLHSVFSPDNSVSKVAELLAEKLGNRSSIIDISETFSPV